MQIAIHKGIGSFSERWIEYCVEHGLPHRTVNAHDSDIMAQLASAGAFLWHWSHGNLQDLLMARHVIRAAEMMGLRVFPSTATCWHFDDKVAQKYALEAIGAPHAVGLLACQSATSRVNPGRYQVVRFILRTHDFQLRNAHKRSE
jgi:hypothetical protein